MTDLQGVGLRHFRNIVKFDYFVSDFGVIQVLFLAKEVRL